MDGQAPPQVGVVHHMIDGMMNKKSVGVDDLMMMMIMGAMDPVTS